MILWNKFKGLGGCLLQMDLNDAIALFAQIVEAGVPYALTWRIGIYIVNTLIEWVTGGSNQL